MRFSLICLLFLMVLPPVFAQSPTPEQTKRVIRVWWSDDLYNGDDIATQNLLEEQVERFNRANADFEVELRLKASMGVGSLLTTLIAAQPVAPSAVPDLVVLPRRDLLAAVRSGVLRPIDSWVPDTLRADLVTNALATGSVDNILYGLPYALSVQHSVYDTALLENPPQTFADVLASEQRFLLPGLPATGQEINDMLLAQYLQAGGRLVDAAGVPTIDQEPLLEVLEFYELGIQAGIFNKDLLTFSHHKDYWSRLLQENIPLGLVDSTLYLQTEALPEAILPAPIPTSDGKSLVIIDSWLWALTTADLDQQRGALEFMEWMMGAEAQADYTQMMGVLPSRRRALRLWTETSYDVTMVNTWLREGVVIPVEHRNNSAAQQIQGAFEAVLNGASYQDAASAALAGLSAAN